MSKSEDYKEAEYKILHQGGVRVVPLSSGKFAVYGLGTQLFGIVRELYPSFVRICEARMLQDYADSQEATRRFREREGERAVREEEAGMPVAVTAGDLGL